MTSLLGVACGGAPPEATARTQLGRTDLCIVSQYTGKAAAFGEIAYANHVAYAAHHGYTYRMYTGRISGVVFRALPADGRPGSQGVRQEGLFWQKHTAIQEMLGASRPDSDAPLCAWAMWVDADILFTNFHSRLEDLLATFARPDTHLLLAREEVGAVIKGSAVLINAGTFIARNDLPAGLALARIRNLFDPYNDAPLADQDALTSYAFQQEEAGAARLRAGLPVLPNWDFASARIHLRPGLVAAPQRAFNAFRRGGNDGPAASWQPCDFIVHVSGLAAARKATIMNELSQQIDGCTTPADWSSLAAGD